MAGTGACLPERVLSNADLERMVDTSDEWIVQRTGIRQRRIAAEAQATSDLAIAAAKKALTDARVNAAELDAIILATISPDTYIPACAIYVQNAIGAPNACAFDLNAACTGFIYAVAIGTSMIRSGLHRHVMVIGAECLSRIVDYTDRNSCILFGDGAGAVVLAPSTDGGSRIIDSFLRADGSYQDLIKMPSGGSRRPASEATVAAREHYMQLNGKEVFKFATRAMVELVDTAVKRNGIRTSDLALVIPHQVNFRIIETAQKKLDIPLDRFFLNLEKYGNTSAASVPIAIDEAVRTGRVRRGDLILLVAFGAGMTWGYNLIRW